ncbi:hypothetical protein JTE90_000398 [Oedothorax gibbosus]|uniref:G-protein coupled receptors family 2 profile 2 domain-containing protein n=1 Tax=Oedothorax gibbosus TaxID=931172 RepID=A0AAV6UTP9_9ARAC|nr:hypothetical protein JTE90_000398 [Oedothorax gibbosus]
MCTYMWMFCEGFYLHKLIAAAFAEQKSLYMFYFIGWVFPIFPVGTVALLRWYFANEQCWAVPVKPYEWVANSLNLLSLFLNLMFLIDIIRVLWTKLKATHANEPSQFRKAVRATLVLVPLFGLHFFLVMYRPQSGDCLMLEGYSYFAYAMDGLQGLLVSLIFCYLNGEVQVLVMRSFQRIRLQRKLTASSDWRRSTRSEELSNRKIRLVNVCQYVFRVIELIRRSIDRFRLRYSLDVQPTSMTMMSDVSMSRSRPSADGNSDFTTSGRWRRSNAGQNETLPNNGNMAVTVELNALVSTIPEKESEVDCVETSLINHG